MVYKIIKKIFIKLLHDKLKTKKACNKQVNGQWLCNRQEQIYQYFLSRFCNTDLEGKANIEEKKNLCHLRLDSICQNYLPAKCRTKTMFHINYSKK